MIRQSSGRSSDLLDCLDRRLDTDRDKWLVWIMDSLKVCGQLVRQQYGLVVRQVVGRLIRHRIVYGQLSGRGFRQLLGRRFGLIVQLIKGFDD
jgi:hypothetical protein